MARVPEERGAGLPADGLEALRQDQRHRLSRELHDRVAHMIAAAMNSLELGEHYDRSGRHDQARAKLTDARRRLGQALEMTKGLAARLRLTSDPRADTTECPTATWSSGAGSTMTPIAASIRVDSEQIFLIVREAINNALAHSGAEHITIRLFRDGAGVQALIEDDGIGVGRDQAGSPLSLGLASMRERTAILGGFFDISSGSGGGMRIVVAIPLAQER
jgi:signal transduction histidine kinase